MRSKLILIRHGLTEGNLNRWYYGRTNLPLSQRGIEKLRELREQDLYPELPEDAQFFVSGMTRTIQTLEELFGQKDWSAIPELREMDFGEFECKTYAEMMEMEGFDQWAKDETGQVPAPGGESRAEFVERIGQGLKKLLQGHRLKELSHRHSGKDAYTVCVCHGGVIGSMMHHMFPDVSSNMWDWIPAPGYGYMIDMEEGEPKRYERISNIRKLGFGLMRLPKIDGEFDLPQIEKMVDMFLERGYTYFDTAFVYDGSEEIIRKALTERYPRDSYTLASKMAAYLADSAEEAKDQFRISCERAGVDFFDYYLLHNLGADRTKKFEEYGIWDYCKGLKAEGKIVKLGFSFHDKADALEEILKKHADDVDFVQLQINYADWNDINVQSGACYEVARRYGKPIVIMEPIRGGGLADLPEAPARILKEADPEASAASWAMRFCMELPGVKTVLSGMSSLEQMEDNLKVADNGKPLTAEERAALDSAREALEAIPRVPCTQCGYCLKGCPQNINIPQVLRALNNYNVYQNYALARGNYGFATNRKGKAGECIGCGACEAVCPQGIAIIQEMKNSAEIFEKEE